MSQVEKYKDHFVLHLEAGFIAVNQADEDSAVKLFKAAEILNPESPLPQIGLGYLAFHKLELQKAIEIFDAVLAKDSGNELAKTFKGMCLSLSPNQTAEGEKILHEIAEGAGGSDAKAVANNAIDFVEKYVKKPISPADLQTKQ